MNVNSLSELFIVCKMPWAVILYEISFKVEVITLI